MSTINKSLRALVVLDGLLGKVSRYYTATTFNDPDSDNYRAKKPTADVNDYIDPTGIYAVHGIFYDFQIYKTQSSVYDTQYNIVGIKLPDKKVVRVEAPCAPYFKGPDYIVDFPVLLTAIDKVSTKAQRQWMQGYTYDGNPSELIEKINNRIGQLPKKWRKRAEEIRLIQCEGKTGSKERW